jgi:hypothetical protein
MADFSAVEARLRKILEAYRDRLEPGPVYGVGMLRRPGGGAHDWFAGIRVGKNYVSYYLMPVYGRPELLAGISPGLRRRKQGKSCFNFSAVDESLMTELEALTERSFEAFMSPAYPREPVSTRG